MAVEAGPVKAPARSNGTAARTAGAGNPDGPEPRAPSSHACDFRPGTWRAGSDPLAPPVLARGRTARPVGLVGARRAPLPVHEQHPGFPPAVERHARARRHQHPVDRSLTARTGALVPRRPLRLARTRAHLSHWPRSRPSCLSPCPEDSPVAQQPRSNPCAERSSPPCTPRGTDPSTAGSPSPPAAP